MKLLAALAIVALILVGAAALIRKAKRDVPTAGGSGGSKGDDFTSNEN